MEWRNEWISRLISRLEWVWECISWVGMRIDVTFCEIEIEDGWWKGVNLKLMEVNSLLKMSVEVHNLSSSIWTSCSLVMFWMASCGSRSRSKWRRQTSFWELLIIVLFLFLDPMLKYQSPLISEQSLLLFKKTKYIHNIAIPGPQREFYCQLVREEPECSRSLSLSISVYLYYFCSAPSHSYLQSPLVFFSGHVVYLLILEFLTTIFSLETIWTVGVEAKLRSSAIRKA